MPLPVNLTRVATDSSTRIGFARFSCLIVCLLLALSHSAHAAGYLHASGTTIVDGNNQSILLRGVNLGNWLYNEAYMTGAPFDNDTWPTGLKDVLGTDTNVATFYAAWRSNYVSQADIIRVKTLGFNSVRAPFDYRLFYDDTTGQPRDDGFTYLDNLLTWCGAVGLYAIPDMHGAPGGQRDPGTFFFDSAKQVIASNIWRRIASRYATNQWLGGYDLINEPLIDTQSEKYRIRDLYVRLTAGIRQVDANHLVFAEGNYYGGDLYDLDPRWDNNMAFSIHNYWTTVPTTGTFAIATQVMLANSAGVPLWMGEFGENSNPWNNAERRSVEGYSLGWAVWPWKITGQTIKCVEWMPVTPGYQALLNYWKYGTNKPSQSAAFTALIDMAQRTALPSCTENKDFIDALLRSDFHTVNIPFALNSAPGRIYGANYDMGNQGLAYTDTVYQTTAQGANYTPWNDGWIYRNDGVDLNTIIENGVTNYYVGSIETNEWLSFTVVAPAGWPGIHLRYASPNGARIHLELDGHNIVDSLALASTGGWLNWATTNLTANTNLTLGVHNLKVFFETDGLNFYWLEFTNLPPLFPPAWIARELGSPYRLGYSLWNAASNIWTVAGGGTNIFGTADQGQFVSRSFVGDGTIVAHLNSMQTSDSSTKAGVMFRDSTSSNAMYAYVFASFSTVGFEYRTNTGATTLGAAYAAGRAPIWLRLTRVGNSFSGYFSTNGVNWRQLGVAQTIPLAGDARAGFAVNGRTGLCTATFDNLALTPSMGTTLIGAGSSWKYNDTGANLGNVWRALDYDDSGWPGGPAQLGFGDGDEFTAIASNKQVTTYFRRPFTVADPTFFTNVIVHVLRDDGAVVYVNSNEVFRSNMPNGTIGYLTPALGAVPAGDETTNFYSTNFIASLLVPGTNMLAVEVHQNTTASSDLSFDLSLEAQFPPPALSITSAATNLALHWPDLGWFRPLFTSDLTPATWTFATNAATVSNGFRTVNFPPATNVSQFFRLQFP